MSFLVLAACIALGKGTYIHAKAVLAQQLLEYAWRRSEQGESLARPWPWADTSPFARLQVPRLDIDQVVLNGASGRVLAFAPGHIDASAAPGDGAVVAISGHRDTHFRWLKSVRIGDRLKMQGAQGDSAEYQVIEHAVYDQADAQNLLGTDAEILRLVTCYPFDALVPGGRARYVVSAARVF